jgi:SAM-dependent methyltransferase
MSVPFSAASRFYEAVYEQKPYLMEARAVDTLIRESAPAASTILDVGCGTGRHAAHLAAMGYRLHGIDMSEAMVAVAAQKSGSTGNPSFSVANALDFRFPGQFDVVMALFHVASYLKDVGELTRFAANARASLRDGGLLLFDFWYGPAVLCQGASARKRTLSLEDARIVRRAEPVHRPSDRAVVVNYTFEIDEADGTRHIAREVHRMRYFDLQEVGTALASAGMTLVKAFSFPDGSPVSEGTWGAAVLARKGPEPDPRT